MENKEQAAIILGPVIGEVTESTARILIEVNVAADVTAILTSVTDQKDVHEVKRKFHAEAAGVFKFAYLKPNTKYLLTFEGVNNHQQRTGSVRTFNPDATTFRVLAAACDRPKNGGLGLWPKLWEQYVSKDKIDLFIRHGDQVYADDAFKAGKAVLKDTSLSEEEKNNKICGFYKQIYRSTWNREPVLKCISNCPQLMLWDDHEIRNDWGTFKQDTDPNSVDWRLALCGRRVYWEYQRQLWEDINLDGDSDGLEGHIHNWGDKFGIIFVDTRGSRSFGFQPSDRGRYIGKRQLATIKQALSKDGKLATVRSLICVHSMPAIYMSTGASSCLSCFPCLKDKMGFGLNPTEQDDYMTFLNNWKQQNNSDVVIVAGDLHIGIRTDVYDDQHNVVLKQIITSPVANNQPPACFSWLLKMFCMQSCCCNATGAEFTFKHTEMLYEWNVGDLVMTVPPQGPATVTDRLITKRDD